jgi:hypothetical protein
MHRRWAAAFEGERDSGAVYFQAVIVACFVVCGSHAIMNSIP